MPRQTFVDFRECKPVQVGDVQSLVAAAVQWAERIMKKIDRVFPKST